MSSFLSSISAEHFASPTREPLLARFQNLSPADLLAALGTGVPPVQHLAAQQLARRSPDEVRDLVLRGLASDPAIQAGVLATLLTLPLRDDRDVLEMVERLLESSDADVVAAAARTVSYRWPDRARILLGLLNGPQAPFVARHLCFSERDDLLPELCAYYGFPKKPPPVVGLLVTAEWLAANAATSPDLAALLARECGYVDDELTPSAVELLESGFGYVSREMATHPAAAAEAGDWRRRVLQFRWELLPDSLGVAQPGVSVDLGSAIDVALFLSAVRETDRSNLSEKKCRAPFGRRTRESPIVLVCAHANAAFVRRQFVQRPLEEARELGVPESEWGTYLIEFARVHLEIDEETRSESDLVRRTRWLTRVRCGTEVCGSPISTPVRTWEDFPAAAQLVAPGLQPPPVEEGLSPGADSIARLLRHFGVDDAAERLRAVEMRSRSLLPPIGIELQVPLVAPNLTLAWKQALRGFGVLSPRRPEYRDMVEAAFRPASSFHSLALGPLVLHRLGLIGQEQEIGLHVSIQGDLGDRARFIAFPALFLTPGRRRRGPSAATRVMSKGLVHLNRDVETIDVDRPAACRTEFRVLRSIADAFDGRVLLRRGFWDEIAAVQLLAAAALSSDPVLQRLWNDYESQLTGFTSTLPPVFGQFLGANFFESTGDARDAGLLDLLPIHRLRQEVQEMLRRDGLKDHCEAELRRIRNQAVARISVALRSESHRDATDGLGDADCLPSIAGPFWCPAMLQESLVP